MLERCIRTEKILMDIEKSLLKNSIRNNKEMVSSILYKDFKEFTSSGKVYNYKNGDVFGELEYEINIIENSVSSIMLNKRICLITYQTEKKEHDTIIIVNRSSIWVKMQNKWKIVFHQGTQSTQNK